MIHKGISAIGLGILGVGPFTVAYLLSMGLRKEKKSNVAFFPLLKIARWEYAQTLFVFSQMAIHCEAYKTEWKNRGKCGTIKARKQ